MTAVLAAALALSGAGCAQKKRIRSDAAAPVQTTGEAAKAAGLGPKEPVLPPPTMSPREVRLALWDMAARQRRGEGAKALADYSERANDSRTLEGRFLAAAAIPDLEAQWDAVHLVAKDQPKFYWAHAQMAAIYAAWKVADQCERELALAAQHGPGIAFTQTVRGHLRRNLGDLAGAVREYQAVLAADPEDAEARAALALARKAQGQTDGYEAQLKQALKDVPTQYEAAEALAVFYDEAERTIDAKAAWTRVAELMPKNRSARLALARLAGDKDPAGAILAYEEASRIQPLTKSEQASLARLYQQVRRTDDEIKSLQLIVKIDPKDPAPWRRLAAIYESKNELSNIESAYSSLRALDPKDPQALMGLAKVAERRVQLRQANELYREAATAGDQRAPTESARLRAAAMLPAKPVTGKDLTAFYRAVLDSLETMYNERLKGAPALKGSLRAKIANDGAGKAVSVDMVENSTSDPYLDMHLYYVLLEGTWPKLKPTDRKTFTLKFDLPPQKN